MPDTAYGYNLDGEITGASGAGFAFIARNAYTRLPERVVGHLADVSLRYDSFGRRIHKIGEQGLLYRNGIAHPAAERTMELAQGFEAHHVLVERAGNGYAICLFTPAGQTVTKRLGGYARVERDHLRSVRAEMSASRIVAAHYSAYGKSIVSGGILRRGFADYEPDGETALYNASLRLYCPETGNFVSVDPKLQFPSPYPYCACDPFNRVDPTGAISMATISSIITGLLLVASVVVTIFTAGAAAPAAVAADVAADAEGAVNAGAAAAAEAAMIAVREGINVAAPAAAPTGLSAAIARQMPATATGFAKFGAGMGFAASALNNGAGLVAKAAQGEHVTAWQTVRNMLVMPAIAGIAGGVGGAIAGPSLATAGINALRRLFAAVLASQVTNVINGVADAAVCGQLKQKETWMGFGISMAISLAEAIALAPTMARVRATYINELTCNMPEGGYTFPDNGYSVRTPSDQWARLRDFFRNPNPRDWGRCRGNLDPHLLFAFTDWENTRLIKITDPCFKSEVYGIEYTRTRWF